MRLEVERLRYLSLLLIPLCFLLFFCDMGDTGIFERSKVKVMEFRNYVTYMDGVYTIKDNFEILLDRDMEFNKFSIYYDSTGYIKGKVTYMLNKEYEEVFFLEPGKDMAFSSLIDGFFAGKRAKSIKKITLSVLKDESCEFKLKNVEILKVKVPKTTVFIENSRYKVGVDLLWGGTLNYIEDKKNKDESITNLLNRHDTGRLVQQAYYGTGEKPYEPGTYNGARWPYNPVQGGDMYGNESKIVDFKIEKDRIYIKCRPRDWAKQAEYTICYMENVYSIEKECIKVHNRFVDFSGYKAKPRHQEMPAFYVISYLDTFVFYNGNNPWTKDELTYKENLPFWANNKDAYFRVKEGNTEVWCAWVDKDHYGIGLYAADTEILLAGIYMADRSKNSYAPSTSYVAPLRTFELKSFEPFEYSYIIAAGKVDEMRAIFNKHYVT